MPETTDIGPKLRDLRKRRGMSQRDLAAASGVSLSTISKLEQGATTGDVRLETAHRLAAALRVTTTRLLRREPASPGPAPGAWLPLQQALESPPAQPDEDISVQPITAGLSAVRAAYFGNRLHDLVALAVPLLRDADALDDGPDARALRAHLLQIAGSVLTQVHAYESAEAALSRALDASPDRLRAASIVTTWVWLLMRQGRLDDAREMAIRWADDLEPRVSRATPEDLAAWGWVLLQLSAACLRDGRKGEAADALRLAQSAAVLTGRELPRGHERLATWGPLTVAYKRAERDIVLDRPDQVLKAAERLSASGPADSTEHHRHRLDVARAHVQMRQHGEAVGVLREVHEVAPEWLVQQRYAQDILGQVVERRRTLTPEMRELVDALGTPV
ncbi:helix-turn-helix domain-containing protein [Streptomyces flavofungini]|uniref:helix-turn-helix domain-containing protein n=1 Tax=Streptomyces flavofungini TaxID=68200 RepID=UPI0025B2426B|nr:helix-turn-helix transcriptional regulator [Streptomyces flavofungini]WJV47657.1 helix-turn-helix transcriptional regulator [Streptomyces flavofungini]